MKNVLNALVLAGVLMMGACGEKATENEAQGNVEATVEEAPVVFLFYDESAVFTLKNIQKFERNAVNLLQVKQLKEY